MLSKYNIAKQYKPNTTKKNVFRFFREVHNCKPLYDELVKLGYKKTMKVLTVPMFEEIKKHFGEPEAINN
ncbi:MAG TPA: DUF4248 domain-containing protein [Salinivirgaceae bacterium]|nr:DUF4248 domain-containing protein [Salinivirgaceae bacterium]